MPIARLIYDTFVLNFSFEKELFLNLLERLKNAFNLGKVEYWSERPENYTKDLLNEIVTNPEVKLTETKKIDRKSTRGKYGMTGENSVHSGKLIVESFSVVRSFYIKWFFWNRGDDKKTQGVEVQSFKDFKE